MAHALSAFLAGTTVPRTSPEYRTYQAGLLLSARMKSAIWLVREQNEPVLRDALREIRKAQGRRNEARAGALGAGCSRMEPTVPRETLDDLRYRYRDPLVQAQVLVSAAIPDLDAVDREAQSAALAALVGQSR